MNELMKIYQILSKKGMINMSPEEFSQLPEEELMKYASLLQRPMQTQQPMMRMGGRVKYQSGDYYSKTGYYSNDLANVDTTLNTSVDNMGDSGKGWDWSGKGGKAGAGIAQIGAALGSMGGNMLKDPEHPTSAKNVAGNILSATAQGAALGSAFGPWGTLIGAVAGTIGGGVQSAQQKKAKEKELNMRSQGRYMNDLQTSYNPELAYGGALKPKISYGEAGDVVSYNAYPDPQAGDGIELARARSLGKSDTQFGRFANGAGGKLSSTSRVRRAGYAQGGATNTNYGSYMPNRYMQDGGELADAEIENNEAVIGNPNSVNLFGGADAEHTSPLGFIAKGAQHNEKNSAGTSGIPMGSSEEMYIGSDKLTLNGWDARGGKKSVADEMKPYLKYAEKAVTSKDPYTNNPQAIKQTGVELARLQTEAEEGKFMRGLYDLVKRKDRDFDEVMGYLQQELPNEFGPNAQAQNEQLTQIENNPNMGQLPSTQEPDYAQMAGNAAVDMNSLDAAMGQAPQGMTVQEQELMQAPAAGQEQMMRNGGRLNMKTKNYNSKQIARAMCKTGCYTKPGRGMYQFGGNTLGIQGTEQYSTPDDQIIFENMSPEDQEQFANLDPQLAQNYLNQQRSFYGVPSTQAYQEPEMLPMAEITASNPLFDESSDLTDDEVKALMQEYAQTQGVPSNLVRDAMGNYFTPATQNMLANTKPYGQGQVALDYQNFTFEPGQGPTVTMPALNYTDNKSITNRTPSIKDVGSQKNLWQNMMNRHATSRLGFVPFDENTLTATPQLKDWLLNEGFSQADIDATNTPGGWGDASNPVVRWVNNMAGGSTLDVDIDDTGSRRMGSFGATQSSGVGSGTMEQTMTTLSNSLTDDRKRRQLGLPRETLDTLDNLSANGNLTADNIRRSLGQGVLDQVLTTIGSNRGTTVYSNPAERLVTETHKQQGERDLTTYKNAQGRTVTLDEAAKLARDYGWDTFTYGDYEYPASKPTPTSSRGSGTYKPSTSTTPVPRKTPPSGTVTKSRSGQASTSKTMPATIQPIRRAIDRSSEYQTITTQPIQKAMGGMTTPKVGQRITFEHGGRIHSGIVKYSNPYTGDFDIV